MINLVPTAGTKRLAMHMIAVAERESGPDAALRLLREVQPDQLHALVGVLLTATKAHRKLGRPRKPLTLSHEDRMRGYSQYRQGIRTDFTRLAYREYQRLNQRQHRARQRGAA